MYRCYHGAAVCQYGRRTYWLGDECTCHGWWNRLTTSIIAILTLTSKKIVKRWFAVTSSDKTAPWQLAGYYAAFWWLTANRHRLIIGQQPRYRYVTGVLASEAL